MSKLWVQTLLCFFLFRQLLIEKSFPLWQSLHPVSRVKWLRNTATTKTIINQLFKINETLHFNIDLKATYAPRCNVRLQSIKFLLRGFHLVRYRLPLTHKVVSCSYWQARISFSNLEVRMSEQWECKCKVSSSLFDFVWGTPVRMMSTSQVKRVAVKDGFQNVENIFLIVFSVP